MNRKGLSSATAVAAANAKRIAVHVLKRSVARHGGRNCEFSGRRHVAHQRANQADMPSAATRSTAKSDADGMLVRAVFMRSRSRTVPRT